MFVISRCDRDETDVLLMCCASAEGPTEVNMTELPIEEVELQLRQLGIQFGGHWRPKDCKPRWKVSLLCLYESTILKWGKKKVYDSVQFISAIANNTRRVCDTQA